MRPLSDASVNRQIAQIDALHQRNQETTPVLSCPDDRPFGSRLYQECREVASHRWRCGYVAGFWAGWVLRSRAPAEEEVTA